MKSMLEILPEQVRYRVNLHAHIIKHRWQDSRIIAGPSVADMVVPRVVAVHFPKGGGSSLVKQFRAALKSQMAVDYAADPLAGSTEPRPFPARRSMVMGHFRPERYEETDAFRVTFLRHPVSTVISIYYFWKTLADCNHLMHHQFLRERPSLIDFARDCRIRYLMSKTYFGGYDMDRFDFICFSETRSSDLKNLSSLLGISLSAEAHINQTAASEEYLAAKSDRTTGAALDDILSDDIRFYERLRTRAAR